MNQYNPVPMNNPVAWISGLLVAGTHESNLIGMGTAFFIGPNVALTARHVVDEIFLQFEGCSPTEVTGDTKFGLDFAHVHPEFGFVKWAVRRYGYSRSIDVAALILEPHEANPQCFASVRPQITVLPPPDGSTLAAYGYPNSRSTFTGQGLAVVAAEPHISTGTVLETHREYRDRSMLTFPCTHTDARFDPGMSGGPVFDDKGMVFGLITSNLPPSSAGESHSSYVSLLWPALGLDIPVQVSTLEPTAPYPLKRLIDENVIDVRESSLIRIDVKDGSNRVTVAWPNSTAS